MPAYWLIRYFRHLPIGRGRWVAFGRIIIVVSLLFCPGALFQHYACSDQKAERQKHKYNRIHSAEYIAVIEKTIHESDYPEAK